MQCCCNRYGFGPQQARPFVRLAARLDANFQGGYTPQQIRFAYDFTASSTGLGQTIALITTGNQPNIESDLRFFSSFFFSARGPAHDPADWFCSGESESGLGAGNNVGRGMGPCAGTGGESPAGLRRFWPYRRSDAGSGSGGWNGRGYRIHELGSGGALWPVGAGTHFPFVPVRLLCSGRRGSIGSSSLPLGLQSSTFHRRHQPDPVRCGRADQRNGLVRRVAGGPSQFFPIPPAQELMEGIREKTGGMRGTPDVSFCADPDYGVAIYHSASISGASGWGKAGGTSFAAPAWAAILAGIRQRGGTSNPQDLYRLAGESQYLEPQPYFIDIVQGESRLYQAQKGWDLCTGLGSPRVSRLQDGLAGTSVPQ